MACPRWHSSTCVVEVEKKASPEPSVKSKCAVDKVNEIYIPRIVPVVVKSIVLRTCCRMPTKALVSRPYETPNQSGRSPLIHSNANVHSILYCPYHHVAWCWLVTSHPLHSVHEVSTCEATGCGTATTVTEWPVRHYVLYCNLGYLGNRQFPFRPVSAADYVGYRHARSPWSV